MEILAHNHRLSTLDFSLLIKIWMSIYGEDLLLDVCTLFRPY